MADIKLAAYQTQALIDLGLQNVDNTADVNKPVSAPQAAALLPKLNPTYTGKLQTTTPLRLDTDPVVVVSQVSGEFNYVNGPNTYGRKITATTDDAGNRKEMYQHNTNGGAFSAASVQTGTLNEQAGQNNAQNGAYFCSQRANGSVQTGSYNIQFGYFHTQSGLGNYQSGYNQTQSGYDNFQSGFYSTQSGAYNTQSGAYNTQSGNYGMQAGKSLNDAGFHATAMFGDTKTATAAKRAYFAMDNGIWLKPFAGDAASPENGVIGYNSTLNKFRFYQGGAWATPVAPDAFNNVSTATTSTQESSATKHHNLQIGYDNTQSSYGSTQSGYNNIQNGASSYCNTQSGYFNTQTSTGECIQVGRRNLQQSAFSSIQLGSYCVQNGTANYQNGYLSLQAGNYNLQSGLNNTQTGSFGAQAGRYLNDGGFYDTAMFGHTKTATVTRRAYFAMDNGIWLKPFAGDAATPENGVICYNETTHKFRGYANGAWVDLH